MFFVWDVVFKTVLAPPLVKNLAESADVRPDLVRGGAIQMLCRVLSSLIPPPPLSFLAPRLPNPLILHRQQQRLPSLFPRPGCHNL